MLTECALKEERSRSQSGAFSCEKKFGDVTVISRNGAEILFIIRILPAFELTLLHSFYLKLNAEKDKRRIRERKIARGHRQPKAPVLKCARSTSN